MKKMIVVIASIAFLISCKPNSKREEKAEDKYVPPVETPIQVIPIDTAVTVTDTTKSVPVTVDPNAIPTFASNYPIMIFNTTIPVELYASDNFELPSDSILALSGIVVKQEDKKIIVVTDSSVIPQDISISYKKGKAIVTQYGKSKEYNAKRVAIEDGIVLIDNQPILPEKELTVLRVGVPGYVSVILNGNSSFSSNVILGNVDITSTGDNNTIRLSEVFTMNNVNLKGNTSLSIDKARTINKLFVADSASVLLKNCDSIFSATVTQKGKLQLPEKTPITKEKTTGEGDIVKQ